MHKRIEAELISLAHQILQMKDKNDVIKLKNKAAAIHEKLAVLEFVDNYFFTTPNASEDKSELKTIVENIEVKEETKVITNKVIAEKEPIIEEITEQKEEIKTELPKILEDLEKKNAEILKAEADEIINKIVEQDERFFKNDVKDVAPNSLANNEEFKDSIPADVAANLFEKAEKMVKKQEPKSVIEKPTPEPIKQEIKANVATKIEQPVISKPKQETKTSLNDRIFKNKLQIGLNDRIAFVKHLFNFSQEDFNRVLSQLNTFESEITAKDFLNNQVKPDYNWSGKEEYEDRLVALIERKFM